MKFDVVYDDHWMTRLAQNLTNEQLDEFCAQRGLKVKHTRAIGLILHEAVVVAA